MLGGMPLIALTGGIASGKSTVAGRMAEHGAVVVDADAVVRDLQQPGAPALAAIAEAFGGGVLHADGTLDRAALASVVFGHPDRIARLNAIMHPAVRMESARRFEAARREAPDAVIVYDVPLLVEARPEDAWDLVVVADAPAAVRVERLVRLRGMTPEQAHARMAAQADDAARLRIADVVIDTGGTVQHTLDQTDALWDRLRPGPGVGAAT